MFIGDRDENEAGNWNFTRTYGTSSNYRDTGTNKVVTQSGGANYPSMIADINDGGPASVQYIHWKSDQDFKVVDIQCYERKRLTKEDMET